MRKTTALFYCTIPVLMMGFAVLAYLVLSAKTIGSITQADAEQLVAAEGLLGKDEQAVIKQLGGADFRIEIDGEVRLQYEIQREVNKLGFDFFYNALCLIIDQGEDRVVDVYISD